MAVNEADIEILETYLDGELPTEQCESLWRRLVEEPDLAAELDRSRGDRALRQAAFASMEPSELMAASTESTILRMKRRSDLLSIASRSLRAVVGVAACILFGFSVGWLGHEHLPASVPTNAINPNPGSGFVVNVEDDLGHVIATKQFNTLQEARDFARDVSQSQVRQRQTQDAPVLPVSDQF